MPFFLRVHTFPRTEHAASQLMARNVPFFVHVVDPSTGILSGYRLAFDFDHTGTFPGTLMDKIFILIISLKLH